MQKVIEVLKWFFTQPKMKTLYWQSLNGFVVILTGTLAGIRPDQVDASVLLIISVAVAVLNRITKEINTKLLTNKII